MFYCPNIYFTQDSIISQINGYGFILTAICLWPPALARETTGRAASELLLPNCTLKIKLRIGANSLILITNCEKIKSFLSMRGKIIPPEYPAITVFFREGLD